MDNTKNVCIVISISIIVIIVVILLNSNKENFCSCSGVNGICGGNPKEAVDSYNSGHTELTLTGKTNPDIPIMPYDQFSLYCSKNKC